MSEIDGHCAQRGPDALHSQWIIVPLLCLAPRDGTRFGSASKRQMGQGGWMNNADDRTNDLHISCKYIWTFLSFRPNKKRRAWIWEKYRKKNIFSSLCRWRKWWRKRTWPPCLHSASASSFSRHSHEVNEANRRRVPSYIICSLLVASSPFQFLSLYFLLTGSHRSFGRFCGAPSERKLWGLSKVRGRNEIFLAPNAALLAGSGNVCIQQQKSIDLFFFFFFWCIFVFPLWTG